MTANPAQIALLNAQVPSIDGFKNNGRNSYISVLCPAQSGISPTPGRFVIHPVCVVIGDSYFQLYTPLSRDISEANMFFQGSWVNSTQKSTFQDASWSSTLKTWALIHMPESNPPILGLSLAVSYDDPDLYEESGSGVDRLAAVVARKGSQISDDDELPGICHELGLV